MSWGRKYLFKSQYPIPYFSHNECSVNIYCVHTYLLLWIKSCSSKIHMLKSSPQYLRMWPPFTTGSLKLWWVKVRSQKEEIWTQTHIHKTLCENKGRDQGDASTSQGTKDWPQTTEAGREAGQTLSASAPALPSPWPWTSSFRSCETIRFCVESHSVCGTLLW